MGERERWKEMKKAGKIQRGKKEREEKRKKAWNKLIIEEEGESLVEYVNFGSEMSKNATIWHSLTRVAALLPAQERGGVSVGDVVGATHGTVVGGGGAVGQAGTHSIRQLQPHARTR